MMPSVKKKSSRKSLYFLGMVVILAVIQLKSGTNEMRNHRHSNSETIMTMERKNAMMTRNLLYLVDKYPEEVCPVGLVMVNDSRVVSEFNFYYRDESKTSTSEIINNNFRESDKKNHIWNDTKQMVITIFNESIAEKNNTIDIIYDTNLTNKNDNGIIDNSDRESDEKNSDRNNTIRMVTTISMEKNGEKNNSTENSNVTQRNLQRRLSVRDNAEKLRIPRVVHMTSKSRCMTEKFKKNVDKWRFPGWSLLIHNEQAVDSLINRYWSEFPELQKAAHCLVSGAGKADLWRALVLYEYGGIYTDIDNAPSALFQNQSLKEIENSQSYFVVEQDGFLSQYFMAATRHHPLMWLLVHKTIQRLYTLNNVDGQYVPRTTGPGALKYAFIAFMNDQGPNIYEGFGNCNRRYPYKYGKVTEGIYTGWDNFTVTIVGNSSHSNEYVIRESVGRKRRDYEKMNLVHFSDEKPNLRGGDIESCFRRIYRKEGIFNTTAT